MVKILENKEKQGLEVYFENKPSQEIIQGLKSHFFRWHTFKKCWYAKKTQERLAFLETLGDAELVEQITSEQVKPQAKTEDKSLFVELVKRKNTKPWNDWKESDFAGACRLADDLIVYETKEHIETRFCFSDEGADYEKYKDLHSDNNKMKNYFIYENLKDLDFYIKLLETNGNLNENHQQVCGLWIDKETNTATVTRRYYGDLTTCGFVKEGLEKCELEPNFKYLQGEDKEKVLAMLKEARAKKEKRCETWWKKYGAEKLHTWTYWANA